MLLARLFRRAAAGAIRAGQILVGGASTDNRPIALIGDAPSDQVKEDVLRRVRFFAPAQSNQVQFRSTASLREILSPSPLLLCRRPAETNRWLRLRQDVYDVDNRHNPIDGWEWCRFSKHGMKRSPVAVTAHQRFLAKVRELKRLDLPKSYVFATGPSLAKAGERTWSDGYRIVCNTIVRDAVLWKHVDPHFVAAGDAIYHFGFTDFARAFRADLLKRLAESNAYFVYPDLFSAIVEREFAEFSDRLIPIPRGTHNNVANDLTRTFGLSGLGNVLNLLLLPLACTLSRNVYLWGFDGRAPDDKLFWSNSSLHSYPELMPSLQHAHPAFFDHYVPPDNPSRYAQSVHGEGLDDALRAAEADGFRFVMMHDSWTPALQRRRG